MLWDQHRDRWTVADYLAKRITYCKYNELTASLSVEDRAKLGRLTAKMQSGATLTKEENDKLNALMASFPLDDLRGACLVPPTDGAGCRKILAELPRKQSEELERVLDRCIEPEIPEKEVSDPLAIALVATGGLGIDIADMTLGQGMAVAIIMGGGKK